MKRIVKRQASGNVQSAWSGTILFALVLLVFDTSFLTPAAAQHRGGHGGGRSVSHSHYTSMPRHELYVHSASVPYARVNLGHTHIFYNHGAYYRRYNDHYVTIAAPYGLWINTLPFGYTRFYIGDDPYFYYYGNYYVPSNNGYETVKPPVGAIVENIPDGYEKVEIDGQTYYTVNGVQYKPVMKDNEIWYQVIKSK
jgi:hypothetical protein